MTTVFLMMMMVISASARPLPAHNLSRPEFHQNVTADFTGYFRSNNTGNDSSVSSSMNALPQQKEMMRYLPPASCQLSICALMNLGQDLQSGGDERAGRRSSDPLGHGK
ncbi:uncharacterized protein zgc:193726 isoform X2 [Thunnus maccoyii]|uniref:uncharacterized protein zgc:193726 isoform X2 n=1 Tax=Thunnus maccoyii TaxID=8240 RepID=UPI001C4D518D|nr:uncharacterized protein zgc:193726 isoform X2 [Thunnus maccoyii]